MPLESRFDCVAPGCNILESPLQTLGDENDEQKNIIPSGSGGSSIL